MSDDEPHGYPPCTGADCQGDAPLSKLDMWMADHEQRILWLETMVAPRVEKLEARATSPCRYGCSCSKHFLLDSPRGGTDQPSPPEPASRQGEPAEPLADEHEYIVPLSVDMYAWTQRETSVTRDYWMRLDLIKFVRRAAGIEARLAEVTHDRNLEKSMRKDRGDYASELEAKLAAAEADSKRWQDEWDLLHGLHRTSEIELARAKERLAAAERERDEETAKLADVRALHARAIEQVQFMHEQASRCSECSGWNGVTTLCDDCYCRDVDEATATERERCLAWFEFRRDGGRGVLLMHREVADRIRNGTPAPKGTTE